MPTKAKSTVAPLSDEAIRHRAYLMWEADGRPDGWAEHYWQKASELAPDVSAKPMAMAMATKTAAALKAGKPKDKLVNPAETAVPKSKTKAASPAKAPKLKAAAAKVAAPAVKARPAAKAPKKKA